MLVRKSDVAISGKSDSVNLCLISSVNLIVKTFFAYVLVLFFDIHLNIR